MTSYSGSRSKLYVSSSAFEATQGVAIAPDKSFNVKSGIAGPQFKEKQSADDTVTGYLAALTRTREGLMSDGEISSYASPDFAAWMFKHIFGQSPTSTIVAGGTTTVYEHVFNAFVASGLPTFTAIKQNAKIPGFIEQQAGLQFSDMSFKSGKGKIEQSGKLIGLGEWLRNGVVEPSISPISDAAEPKYMIGIKSNLSIDGTPLGKGLLLTDWSLTINPGYAIQDGAGSTDGAQTSIDFDKARVATADFTIKETGHSYIDDFSSETSHTWEFIMTGPTIDVGHSLTSLIAVKFMNARIIDAYPTTIKHGVQATKLKIESLIDSGTGFDLTCRVRNLQVPGTY